MVIIKYGYIPCDVKYILLAYLFYASSLYLRIPSSCLSPHSSLSLLVTTSCFPHQLAYFLFCYIHFAV